MWYASYMTLVLTEGNSSPFVLSAPKPTMPIQPKKPAPTTVRIPPNPQSSGPIPRHEHSSFKLLPVNPYPPLSSFATTLTCPTTPLPFFQKTSLKRKTPLPCHEATTLTVPRPPSHPIRHRVPPLPPTHRPRPHTLPALRSLH